MPISPYCAHKYLVRLRRFCEDSEVAPMLMSAAIRTATAEQRTQDSPPVNRPPDWSEIMRSKPTPATPIPKNKGR